MNFRGLCRAVYGLDPDSGVLSNPHCDLAKVGTGESIAWGDHTFDLVFADNVLEHLPEPEKVFAEVARVLKPGGLFLAKTPNLIHYVTITAQLTPTVNHQFINNLRGRAESGTFPTRHRANSATSLHRLAAGAGLRVVEIEHIEGRPAYMRVSQLLYPLRIVWERAVNSAGMFRNLRVLLVATFQKV
jgi:SAM-dependent methyltransferase